MSETSSPDRPRRRRRFGIWMLLSLALLAGLGGLGYLAFTGRMIAMPGWITAQIEQRVNKAAAPVSVELGAVDLFFGRDGTPRIHLNQVRVRDGAGRAVAHVPDASAELDPVSLLSGKIALRRMELTGAEMTLRRAPDGAFDLALGDSVVPVRRAETLADVLAGIDNVLAHPILAQAEGLSAERVSLTYDDARAGRVWRVENGLLAVTQSDEEAGLQLFFSLRNDVGNPSEVALTFDTVKGSPETRVAVNFSDMPSGDIATQSPALAFLTVFDAPISGALRSGVTAEGALAPLDAALEIGQGALVPVEGASPIRFDRGKSYFSYRPETGKLNFDEIAVDTDAVRLRADGHAFLRDEVDGWPQTLISQIRFRAVELDPAGVFESPAVFTGGALDLKLQLDPFTATIGQVVLTDDDGGAYRGRGTVAAAAEGWSIDLDLNVNEITDKRLLALWPVNLVPKTRDWIANNVLSGVFLDLHAALRLRPDSAPRMTLNHEFKDSVVRFLRTMPPIENGRGYATIYDKTFTLVAEEGVITAPQGGTVDVSGSVMRVPDITQKPATGEITLQTDSAITPMLSLLDLAPLTLMSKAGQPVDIAEGRAVTKARITVPLSKKVRPQEVDFQVEGRLFDLNSDKLVPSRVLTSPELELRADTSEISIGGSGALDGVPLHAVWSQRLGEEHKGRSRVEGTVELSQRAVDAFNIGLPKGSVNGAGVGTIALDLVKDRAPAFTLTSDLNRVGLRLADLGWSKARNSTGRLFVSGSLGKPAAVDRLEFSAPGLSAEGSVSITTGGTLKAARFSRVRLGGWLDAPVVLTGQGKGASPKVAVTGGTVDLRKRNTSGGSGGSAGRGQQVEVALDRLIVSEGIRLSDVRGSLATGRGLSGTLTGQVIGGAPISAELSPHENGTQIRVRSKDAGRVLRGAGIFEKSRGGKLDLRLTPLGPSGHYDGKVSITNTRVRGAPVLAELLSAISVIGLLEQMGGEGLLFSDVKGNFALTPETLHIKKGSAIGPSLGISLAGLYTFETNRLKMQGVISPIYALNALGSFLTRNREGLFGFNYKLRGPASDPKVSVNPLSILTPGMFREIFRSPPPEPKKTLTQ